MQFGKFTMFKLKSVLVATALALSSVAGMAQNAPASVQLDPAFATDPQDGPVQTVYDFTGTGNSIWSISLNAGQYLFDIANYYAPSTNPSNSSAYLPQELGFDAIWLSSSPSFNSATGNLGNFNVQTDQYGDFNFGTLPLTLGTTSTVYLNVARANADAFGGSLQVTSVPEPATGAMLLAGLGLMGAMVRRRKLRD
jgi:hypothetical protein